MRIHEFLLRTGWQARYRGELLDAAEASLRVGRAAAALRPQLDGKADRRLVVFLAFTPLEALCWFMLASHQGLLAAVVTPRTLGDFLAASIGGGPVVCVLADNRPEPQPLRGWQVLRVPLAAEPAAQPAAAVPVQATPPAAEAARLVFCSSGTTGTPKRIVYDETRLVANARIVADYLELDRSDRSLCAFPITYMYGLSTTLCALHSDSAIDYVDFSNPRVMAVEAERRGITVLPVLGDWSGALAEEWGRLRFRAGGLRLLNASDRITVPQVLGLRPFCGRLWNNFGQTESGPRLFALEVTRIQSFDRFEHDGIIAPGYPVHPDIQTRVQEPSSQGVGPLLYSTPFAMRGLLRRDLSIEAAPEWIASGDHFQRDWDGLHKWGGRTAHTLKISGQLVSLRAVADGLLTIEGVSGVGYAKSDAGALFLFVETEDPEVQSARGAAIADLLALLLPAQTVRLRFLDRLPRTETGKLDTRALCRTITEETV